jgi:hypothetical protein
MFLNRSEYDRGPNTFSPEGRLFQVTKVVIVNNIFNLNIIFSTFL